MALDPLSAVTSRILDIPEKTIRHGGKVPASVLARQVMMWVMAKTDGQSLTAVGQYFGFEHNTVSYALGRVEAQRARDEVRAWADRHGERRTARIGALIDQVEREYLAVGDRPAPGDADDDDLVRPGAIRGLRDSLRQRSRVRLDIAPIDNDMLGGYAPGSLNALVAPRGHGKSMLALRMIRPLVYDDYEFDRRPARVVIFSTDEPRDTLLDALALISAGDGVHADDGRVRDLCDARLERLDRLERRLTPADDEEMTVKVALHIIDRPKLTCARVAGVLKRVAAAGPITMVLINSFDRLVDYSVLHDADHGGEPVTPAATKKRALAELKDLAGLYKTPIIALADSDAGKVSYGDHGVPELGLDALNERESYEAYCDSIVLFCRRKDANGMNVPTYFRLAHNRGRKVGAECELNFVVGVGRFDPVAAATTGVSAESGAARRPSYVGAERVPGGRAEPELQPAGGTSGDDARDCGN